MKVSLSWLKDYVNIKIPVDKLAEELTMRSIEVNTVEKGAQFDGQIVIGRVVVVSKHPNADKLRLAVVDIGREKLKVVCGAANLEEGQKIVFGQIGAVLRPLKGDEVKLKKAVIRGIESPGMILSEMELGLSEEARGIMVLPDDAPVGKKFRDYFGTNDTVLDLDVLSNRPDCMGHIGVAREIAAITGSRLNLPRPKLKDKPQKNCPLKVEIADQKICPRYSALVISGLEIKDSPKIIQDRLKSCGFRPINNVVDLTNYLMLDLGQPFHAFDYDKVEGSFMRVRAAKNNEVVTTLDSVPRKLTSGIPIIEDGKKLIDLAGIMGGENSEIDKKTVTIVLQAAVFEAIAIRRASRILGHRTGAVGLFEKGVDPAGTMDALAKAYDILKKQLPDIKLELIVDEGRSSFPACQIPLNPKRAEDLLGLSWDQAKIKSALVSLGMGVEKNQKNNLLVSVPSFRPDLSIEEDLIEEVARILGYDLLPETVISGDLAPPEQEKDRRFSQELSQYTASLGFQEVINYSFISGQLISRAGLKAEDHIEVANPLSDEQKYMRSEHLSSLLSCLAKNIRIKEEIRLFEFGQVYFKTKSVPEEKLILSGLIVLQKNEDSFFQAKGALAGIMEHFNINWSEEEISPDQNVLCPYWSACDQSGAVKYLSGKKVIGTCAPVNSAVLDKFDIPSDISVSLMTVFFDAFSAASQKIKEFSPLPKYPSVYLDMAFTVSPEIMYKDIEAAIYKAGGKLLSKAELFDVYTGKQARGQKSLAFHLEYRADDRTLELSEAQGLHDQIAGKLKKLFGAELR